MTVLVTGSKGMIGSHLVKDLLNTGYEVVGIDLIGDEDSGGNYHYYKIDLADKLQLKKIVECHQVDRIIHLAALAHATDGKEYTWADYEYLNINCAKNVFGTAGDRPVLFISTVDVFGFTKGIVNAQTKLHPVSNYGKSKAIA